MSILRYTIEDLEDLINMTRMNIQDEEATLLEYETRLKELTGDK